MICEKCGKKVSVSKGKCDSCGVNIVLAAAGSFELKPDPVYFEQENNILTPTHMANTQRCSKAKMILIVILAVCVSGALGWFAKAFFDSRVNANLANESTTNSNSSAPDPMDGWDDSNVIRQSEEDGYYLVAKNNGDKLDLELWHKFDEDYGKMIVHFPGEDFSDLFSPVNNNLVDSSTASPGEEPRADSASEYDKIIETLKNNSLYLGEGVFAVSPFGKYSEEKNNENFVWYCCPQNPDATSNVKFKNYVFSEKGVFTDDSERLTKFVNGSMIVCDSESECKYSVYTSDSNTKQLDIGEISPDELPDRIFGKYIVGNDTVYDIETSSAIDKVKVERKKDGTVIFIVSPQKPLLD